MIKKREKIAIGLSFFLGFIFIGSGMSKLFADHGFPGLIGPLWLEERLAEYGLGLYARSIAYGQALIGFVLFTLLFRTLGAVMLMPMLGNILMVTISLQWPGTPYVLAVFLSMNIVLLLIDLPRVAPLIGLGSPGTRPLGGRPVMIWGIGLMIFLLSAEISYLNVWLAHAMAIGGILLGLLGHRIGQKHARLHDIKASI